MLEDSMRKLDEEMQKTDKLLYSMIPKTVANRLRKGDLAVNTCEVRKLSFFVLELYPLTLLCILFFGI